MRWKRAISSRTAALALSALLGWLTQAGAQAPESAADAAAAPLPAAHELVSSRQALQELLFSFGTIDTASFIGGVGERIANLRTRFDPIGQAVAGDNLDELTMDALLDLEIAIRSETADLQAVANTLRTRAGLRDTQLDELERRRTGWQELAEAAGARGAPAEILGIADDAAALIDDADASLRTDRDAALRALSGILDLQLDTATVSREIRDRRQVLESTLQRASGLPLWSRDLAITAEQLNGARSSLLGHRRYFVDYLRDHGLAVLASFVLCAAATLLLLRAGRERVGEFAHGQLADARAMAVFEKPIPAALLVGAIGVLLFAPQAPVAFANVWLALLPWPAARMATTVAAKPLRLSAYTLAAALSLVALRPFYDVLPLVSRSISFVLTLAVAGAFLVDLRRGNWSRALPGNENALLKGGVILASLVLLVVVVLGAVGFVGIAHTLRTLTLGALGFGMIFVMLSPVLHGLVLSLLQARALSRLSTVRHAPWAIFRAVRKLIDTLAVLVWAALTLNLSGLGGTIANVARAVLAADISIGAVSISVSAVLTGFLVVWLAWQLNRFVQFVMRNRALDYKSAASGLSFAVSKVFGYAVLVVGFVLALAAMGFDLTRVTVLAGALGVGIGLGLQNIANNFVSGIILLFERPIQVNDIAKVDDTIGTIKEIGLRSTIVQTFDGAEVIVPNADFMAKTVLNWTRSNRYRRAEIDVGVAYGSNTAEVLEILNSAATANNDVTDDPAPFATFTGFGDSSLNFRLYVWIRDLANYLLTPSAIRQDILARLDAAGISIPFPQRDIRVTMSAEAATGAKSQADRNT